jgi:hypothetical protein
MKCFCGADMIPAGYGAYPYNCRAKELRPDDMVYVGCKNGHTCWATEHGMMVNKRLQPTSEAQPSKTSARRKTRPAT